MNMNGKTYGIADALSELLEAAVTADTKASQKSIELIKKYAYGEVPTTEENGGNSSFSMVAAGQRQYLDHTINNIVQNTPMKATEGGENSELEMTEDDFVGNTAVHDLAMAKFTMKDPSGGVREVSIPQITMMPLPLLHVTEATFDIDLSVNLVDKSSYVGSLSEQDMELVGRIFSHYRTSGLTTIDGLISYLEGQLRLPYYARPRGATSFSFMSVEEQLRLLYKYKASTESTIGSNSSFMVTKDKEEHADSTTNLKVNVKMKQAELPEGIKLMLQAAANSIQTSLTANKDTQSK